MLLDPNCSTAAAARDHGDMRLTVDRHGRDGRDPILQ
jgi:hypothetical protein